jgi:NAD-dependent SIR2 family protein deacetylase
MTSIPPHKVVVFLGAGASTQFGVPDAKGLLKSYLKACTANKTKSNLTAKCARLCRSSAFLKKDRQKIVKDADIA